MKILLVNDFYSPHTVGGAETLVTTLAATLAHRGHEVALCTARTAGLPAHATDAHGIEVYRIGKFPAFKRSLAIASGTAPSRPSRETVAGFQNLLNTYQPDVIHFHNVWLLGPALIAVASKGGKQVGVTLHDYWPVCVRRSMIRVNWQPCSGPEPFNCRLCRLRGPSTLRSLDILGIERERAEHAKILAGCQFITAPSRFVAEQVARGIGREVTVVPNGVLVPSDLAASCPAQEVRANIDAPYVLFASRTSVEKGYDMSIEAFRDPMLEGYDLLVAGNAPEHTVSVGPNVRILGRQLPSQISQLMAGAACVIVPSLWPEPFGLVLIEAMLQGVPVVATRRGAIPEIIQNGVTGILIEPPNANTLADAILRACTDETLRASARCNGPRAVRERFSLDIMVARLEELYAA